MRAAANGCSSFVTKKKKKKKLSYHRKSKHPKHDTQTWFMTGKSEVLKLIK